MLHVPILGPNVVTRMDMAEFAVYVGADGNNGVVPQDMWDRAWTPLLQCAPRHFYVASLFSPSAR